MTADPGCDCDGCREFRAVHARLSPEPSRSYREAKRAADRAAQRRYEDACADRAPTLPWAV